MATINEIVHASLLVADTARSLLFYRNVLGLELDPQRPALGFPGAWLQVGRQQIHLLELPSPDPVSNHSSHGGRDRHVAFSVDELDVLTASLEAAGVEFTRSRSGRRAVFCRDPDGNALEFIEGSVSLVGAKFKSFEIISRWISDDKFRLECLKISEAVMNDEWYLSAGFVRNLIWDKLQGYKEVTPLNDIDLIYFDTSNTSPDRDVEIENELVKSMPNCHWSVKNQARMSLKHGHDSYNGCIEAMSYWPEIQTAIGVTLTKEGVVSIGSPFSACDVIRLAATRNPKCTSKNAFQDRVSSKKWLELWPELTIET